MLVSPVSPTFPASPGLDDGDEGAPIAGLGSFVRASELRGAIEAARAARAVDDAPLEE